MSAATPLQTRHWVLAGGLAVSLAATLWAAQSGDEEAPLQAVAGQRRAAAPGAPSKVAEAPLPVVNWNTVPREPWAPVADTQFAAWSPPAPPPPPPAPPPPPPPAPMAPPFPYQLIGRLVEGDQAQALLAGPTRSLAVKAGETIDGQWRVDQISPTGLSLTWLPAKLTQNISFRPMP